MLHVPCMCDNAMVSVRSHGRSPREGHPVDPSCQLSNDWLGMGLGRDRRLTHGDQMNECMPRRRRKNPVGRDGGDERHNGLAVGNNDGTTMVNMYGRKTKRSQRRHWSYPHMILEPAGGGMPFNKDVSNDRSICVCA